MMKRWLFIKMVKQPNEDETMFKERIHLYEMAVEKHNKMMDDNPYYDSGFDLFQPHMPEAMQDLQHMQTYKLGLGLQGAMYEFHHSVLHDSNWEYIMEKLQMYLNNKNARPLPYKIHPRSSIYKKSFRLANCTGIIDTGYRGNLGALIDNNNELGTLPKEDRNKIVPHQRYFQICTADLKGFYVNIVDELPSTERGEGGFGSTGK